ncbi:Pal1 cell morphology protein [Xylariales sp. AK1849]|nr:Pal1 cell morphology protein [Xylariales sp. AK1849]
MQDNMIIDDKPTPANKPLPRPVNGGARGPPRGPSGGPPLSHSHRPSRSQEEALRARRVQERNGSTGGEKLDIFASPQKRAERRPRRNSESSVMDMEKPMTEEDKKQREMRRRERDRRYRESKDKDKDKGKSGRPSRRLDLIDQLDATSIYGTGLFHHDGPFDALNPHRNRKGSSRAPMQAFPKDSVNMSIGGAGPLNARPDHATFMGKHDEEAFRDYNVSGKDNIVYEEPQLRKDRAAVFDTHNRGSILHGDESMGLGTSTFLEGTPAARTAVQRSQAEMAQDSVDQGIQRKKSLAQRIRGINRGPRDPNNTGRMTNPDGVYGPRSGDLPTGYSISERNPFFNEYDKSGEERITVRRKDANPMSPASPNSPPRGLGLERRATTDAGAAMSPDGGAKPQGSGLLARVKSLKGGRRQRPEPPSKGPAPGYAPPPAPTPGTAV